VPKCKIKAPKGCELIQVDSLGKAIDVLG